MSDSDDQHTSNIRNDAPNQGAQGIFLGSVTINNTTVNIYLPADLNFLPVALDVLLTLLSNAPPSPDPPSPVPSPPDPPSPVPSPPDPPLQYVWQWLHLMLPYLKSKKIFDEFFQKNAKDIDKSRRSTAFIPDALLCNRNIPLSSGSDPLDYLLGSEDSAVIFGQAGVGKSSLFFEIARRFEEQERPVIKVQKLVPEGIKHETEEHIYDQHWIKMIRDTEHEEPKPILLVDPDCYRKRPINPQEMTSLTCLLSYAAAMQAIYVIPSFWEQSIRDHSICLPNTVCDLSWGDGDTWRRNARRILKRRIFAYYPADSNSKPDPNFVYAQAFEALFGSKYEEILDQIINPAHGSVRTLLETLYRIIERHFAQLSDKGNTNPISESTVKAVLKNKGKE